VSTFFAFFHPDDTTPATPSPAAAAAAAVGGCRGVVAELVPAVSSSLAVPSSERALPDRNEEPDRNCTATGGLDAELA